MVVTGINGFGRFALHLLKWWLDRRQDAAFSISYINDDVLSLQQAHDIITRDPYVRFDAYRICLSADSLLITAADGATRAIQYTNAPLAAIPWRGEPGVVFECSGKATEAARCRTYLTGRTQLVLISATSWDADLTLIYGFNHEAFAPERHRIVSYGSCTVNAYVPLAHWLHERYGIVDSDVNVVHNIVLHRLSQHNTLQRKVCTLERSAPLLLPFLDESRNFVVTYSVVPWAGVSMIDFRFRLARPAPREEIEAALAEAFASGGLKDLYRLVPHDEGPEAHQCTWASAVLVADGIKVRGDNVYLPGYFDTENSVNRFLDLANAVIPRLGIRNPVASVA
jgi:glyceraldehyde 3-phosphate dehydrogenase